MTKHTFSLSQAQAEEGYRQVMALLRHDPARGITVWGDTRDPVMLVWSPRILEFLEVLEGTISYLPARGICRQVGFRSGFDGARAIRDMLGGSAPTPAQVLLQMPTVLAGSGWGVSEVAYDDEARTVAWRFPMGTAVGVAAASRGQRALPACAFIEGFGAGWVKGSVDLGVEFVEDACIGSGGPVCSFASQSIDSP